MIWGSRTPTGLRRVSRRAAAVAAPALLVLVVVMAPLAFHASETTRATLEPTGVLFADGFESGDLSKWTVDNGLTVQQTEVATGQWAAQAAGDGRSAFAVEQLPPDLHEVYVRVRFQISQVTTRVAMLKLRSPTSALVVVCVTPDDHLLTRTPGALSPQLSVGAVSEGDWHELQIYASVDSAAAGVWLDGVPLTELSLQFAPGMASIDGLLLGNPQPDPSYDLAFDDVVADDAYIDDGSGGGVDQQAPSTPTNLRTTFVARREVDLDWRPSSDDVGVAGYTIYRDGSPLTTVPTSRSAYRDTAVQPATTYLYAVDAFDLAGNHSEPSPDLSVTTPGVAPSDPMIAAAGDIACSPDDAAFNGGSGSGDRCRMGTTGDLLAGADAVLPLGDEQYETGALNDFRASYDPAWGGSLPVTHPTVGNHEYETPGASGYYSYFGTAAGDPSKGYYAYDLGAWRLISLNSECQVVSCAADSPQYQWLKDELSTHTNACTLAYWHHPLFSSGSEHGGDPRSRPFWKLLYQYGADVVLNGHDHDYERFAPQDPLGQADANGIREFVVGTGGRSLNPLDTPQPNSRAGSASSFGVLRLTLHDTSFDWAFVPATGTFTDAGAASCA
ncbi:MAG: metallophosphoesterase [Actinomycetota bacterium]|nr:metallophosphoesterase [Actinomycetota bacterium]